MNPTPKQCNGWYLEACKRVNESTTTDLLHVNAVMHIVCELAARWGAEQQVMRLAQGVSVEPEFKWCSVLQALPEENTYVMVCFGVDVVEGSYGSGLWLSLAHGEAQPDYWAYHPKPPHHRRDGSMYTLDQFTTAIAAARVQVYDECMKLCDPDALGLEQGDDCATGVYRVEKAIRALKGGAA